MRHSITVNLARAVDAIDCVIATERFWQGICAILVPFLTPTWLVFLHYAITCGAWTPLICPSILLAVVVALLLCSTRKIAKFERARQLALRGQVAEAINLVNLFKGVRFLLDEVEDD